MNIYINPRWHKIIAGETILSWVCRGISSGKLKSPHLFRSIIQKHSAPESIDAGAIPQWPQPFDSDPEFDESSYLISLLCEIYNEPVGSVNGYFRKSSLPLTNLRYRILSCEECLAKSFLSYRFPVWKKDWCYLTSAYCTEHHKLLTCPPVLPPIASRMWDCYLSNLSRGVSPVKADDKRLALLAGKAQAWIQRRAQIHPSESDALHALYGVFLSKRTLPAVEGVAASGFGHPPRAPYRWPLSMQDRLSFGMNSASGIQRGGAMLLIGWLLEIYPAKDIHNAIRGNRMVRRSLPTHPRTLGSLAGRICTTREEGEMLVNQLQALREYQTHNIAEFMTGLKAMLLSMK